MIKRIKILLENKNDNTKPSFQWGYQLYGYICDLLDTTIVEKMHESMITPLCQYLQKTSINNQFEWNIFIFGTEIENLEDKINIGNIIKLTKYNTDFEVINKEIDVIYQKDFCKSYIIDGECSKIKKIRFLTPCSFKSNGEYVMFPSSNLILNSALSKWNVFFDKYSMNDEDVVEQLQNSCKIIDYNLKSSSFLMKNVKIKGFMGEVTLKLTGSERIVALNNMLLDFLEYSGVGIKTALGMGACKIIK